MFQKYLYYLFYSCQHNTIIQQMGLLSKATRVGTCVPTSGTVFRFQLMYHAHRINLHVSQVNVCHAYNTLTVNLKTEPEVGIHVPKYAALDRTPIC